MLQSDCNILFLYSTIINLIHHNIIFLDYKCFIIARSLSILNMDYYLSNTSFYVITKTSYPIYSLRIIPSLYLIYFRYPQYPQFFTHLIFLSNLLTLSYDIFKRLSCIK